MTKTQKRTPTRPCGAAPRGFTTVELLVVIGIIAVLVSLLVPLVGRMNTKAKETSTAAFLQSLSVAIEKYYQDFRAYPGPLSNDEVYRSGAGAPVIVAVGPYPAEFTQWQNSDAARVTMAENLVLGLLGGLRPSVSGTGALQIQYDPSQIGRGPMSLNPSNPKVYAAYSDQKNLSWRDENGRRSGAFKDDVGSAQDTIIPEYVDTFSDPLPILYLRAKRGTSAPYNDQDDNPVITDDIDFSTGRRGQYDLSQIYAYTESAIGVGKNIPQYYVNGSTVNAPQPPNAMHGLRTVDVRAVLGPQSDSNYDYPYDAFPYFRDPTLSGPQLPASPPGRQVPRQKDRFILISAGADRIYGTKDDITSFGSVAP